MDGILGYGGSRLSEPKQPYFSRVPALVSEKLYIKTAVLVDLHPLDFVYRLVVNIPGTTDASYGKFSDSQSTATVRRKSE